MRRRSARRWAAGACVSCQSKDEQQQAVHMLHRMRALQIAERTALVNPTRGLLAEFGIVVAQGLGSLRARLLEILEDGENALPDLAWELF